MAHLALTDVEGEGFHAFERFARGAHGLAGVTTSPFRGWLGDWVLSGPEEERESHELFPLTLRGREGEVGLSLTLDPVKPMVLQGDSGLSRKGPEPGNASFYYSFTRMEAAGELFLGPDTMSVQGLAWMDREWSTSVLSPGQVGWDWFALQLDDGSDLMYYQLRLEDGSPEPLSNGVLVEWEGDVLSLDPSAVKLQVLDGWDSPLDGVRYPARWLLSVPGEELTLTISPLLPNQELDLTFRYWEGAVVVSGRRGEREIEGRGYVELTGYSEVALSRRGGIPARRPSSR
jgi:predicted secreted hydrolase